MKHQFKSINSFANMYNYKADYAMPPINYVLKPKLHGSNASILISLEGIECRSKNRVLSPENDHMNFCKAMMVHEKIWLDMLEDNDFQDLVVYGEWAGPGVQKTDAVSSIPEKTFFIFAIYYPPTETSVAMVNTKNLWMDIYVPLEVSNVVEVPVLHEFKIPFDVTKDISEHVKLINKLVESFEEEDPYIKGLYSVDGPGEGIVGSPSLALSLDEYFEYTFKAKTEAHRVKKTKEPASAKEPLPQEALEFANTFVTIPRLKQCVHELKIEVPEMRFTPQVMDWMKADIWKESIPEVEAMGVSQKSLEKVMGHKIVALWKGYVNGQVETI